MSDLTAVLRWPSGRVPDTQPAAGAPARGLRLLLPVVLGIAVGCLTSFGQTYLDAPWSAFANSASGWLLAPFLVGALAGSRRGAAAAGLLTCSLQLVGYYMTSELRGFPPGGSILVFWAACAVIGGPLFGIAGNLWRTGPTRLRGLGGAMMASAFLAEGLWTYLHLLGYRTTAVLWLAIGGALALTLARGVRDLGWLALALPAGLLAEIALSAVYSQAF